MTPKGDFKAGRVAKIAYGTSGFIMVIVSAPLRFVRWIREWTSWWVRHRSRRRLIVVLMLLLGLSFLLTRVYRLELRYGQAAMAAGKTAETFFIPASDPDLAPEEDVERMRNPILRMMALGHESLLADLLFIRANQYFVGHLEGDRIFHWFDIFVDAMLVLDPDNVRVYLWASQAVKYGQMINNELLVKSNEYSGMGISRFPDNWRLYMDIGFNYLVEWTSESDAERDRIRRKALDHFAIAAALPDSQLDPNFVTSLYLSDDDVEMALFHAYLRYWDASDEEREQLLARIRRYESRAIANELNEKEGLWRSYYPYISIWLFEQLGTPRAGWVPSSWAHDNGGNTGADLIPNKSLFVDAQQAQ